MTRRKSTAKKAPKAKIKATKKKVKKTRVRRISFEKAIELRTNHPGRQPIQKTPHDTTAHDVAVEDGAPAPMMRFTDVKTENL